MQRLTLLLPLCLSLFACPGSLGGECESASQCAGTMACFNAVNDTMCTSSCDSSRDCDGEMCVQFTNGKSLCAQRCYSPNSQSTCRKGLFCEKIGGSSDGACL